MPSQKPDIDPAKAYDLKAAGSKNAPKATETATSTRTTTSAVVPTPATEEVPKKDFAIGIKKTDAEKEAEKRAARAKRFGIAEDEEEKKKLERAKKFGAGNVLEVKGLDDALPERRAKRDRDAADKQGGRNAKRQTPDRRTETSAKGITGPAKKPIKQSAKQPVKQPAKRITDDPVEKAKAEARAKRFQTTA
jgi:SAP domain-containing ribonucleoprotein